MDCTAVASHLVAYHFATLEDDVRDGIDAHLLECRSCLETFLALKRAHEKRPLEKPSKAVRDRLRADVAEAFAKKEPARIAVLGRRIPLYQGLALAAVAAAVALILPDIVARSARPDTLSRDSRGPAHAVDTARPNAGSLQIY